LGNKQIKALCNTQWKQICDPLIPSFAFFEFNAQILLQIGHESFSSFAATTNRFCFDAVKIFVLANAVNPMACFFTSNTQEIIAFFWAVNKFKTNARHSVNKFGTISTHTLYFVFLQKLKKIGKETYSVKAATTHL